LDQLDFFASSAERLEYAVDSITRKTEDRPHAPFQKPINQNICNGMCHAVLLFLLVLATCRTYGGLSAVNGGGPVFRNFPESPENFSQLRCCLSPLSTKFVNASFTAHRCHKSLPPGNK
jgi:hypothetical protein